MPPRPRCRCPAAQTQATPGKFPIARSCCPGPPLPAQGGGGQRGVALLLAASWQPSWAATQACQRTPLTVSNCLLRASNMTCTSRGLSGSLYSFKVLSWVKAFTAVPRCSGLKTDHSPSSAPAPSCHTVCSDTGSMAGGCQHPISALPGHPPAHCSLAAACTPQRLPHLWP